MTPVIDLDRDDDVVRELLAPLTRVQPVTFRRHTTRHRARRFRPVLAGAVAVLALAGVGAGVAAASGRLPWWHTEQAVMSLRFVTSADPATVPGTRVSLSVPGPESTTFEVVTNNTERVGTVKEHCTAIVVKDTRGRSQGGWLTSCGAASAIIAKAGSFDWQAPSRATYTVISGPTPVSTAAKVSLLASDGSTATTEPVRGGYYLVYAPAQLSTGSLVFYDKRGQVVGRMHSPHP
jgi:hypothetical protein